MYVSGGALKAVEGQPLGRTASASASKPASGSTPKKPSPTFMVTLKNAVVTLAKICAVIIGAPVFVVGGLANLAGSTSSFATGTRDFVTSIFKPPGNREIAALTVPIQAAKPPRTQEIAVLTVPIQDAKPTGQQEIAALTATIQTANAEDIRKPSNIGQCSNDFFRGLPKMEVILPGGGRIEAPIAGGEKAFLMELLRNDPTIPDSIKTSLAEMPLNNVGDMLAIIQKIPENSMTYSLIKMMNQSMIGDLTVHMSTAFFAVETGIVPATNDRRIVLDISDLGKPKVTSSQIFDYTNETSRSKPVLSVSTALSVQLNLNTHEVSSSVEFNSIHTPTANASLKGAQEHFKALGAKEVGLVEHLKGMSIESQLITLNSEYAKPAQQDAVKAALTELVQYHIEQGTGQEFTSAAIISQMKSEMAVTNFESATLLRLNCIAALAFVAFANAVGRECLEPIKEKMDAIGNDDRLKTATEVFDIVANVDSRMPDSLKAVLRDLIQAAGDHGKRAFAGTLFLRALNPIIAPSKDDNPQTKAAKTDISAVLTATVNAFSDGRPVVLRQESRQYLQILATSNTTAIDKLYTRLKEWTSPPPSELAP